MHIFYNTFEPLHCEHYLKCSVSNYITHFEFLPKILGTLNDCFITNLHIKLLCTVLVPFLASSLWCVIVPVCVSSASTCSPSCFCNCCCCLFAAFVPIVFPIFHCLLCCFIHSSFMVSSSIFLHFLDATVESQLCIILCVLCTDEVIVHLYGKNKTYM